MKNVLIEYDQGVGILTLDRVEKHNAFDDNLLMHLQQALEILLEDKSVKVILLKAKGSHFSAGADVQWMQKMADCSEEDNLHDAEILGKVLYTLYTSPKPTLAMAQGRAFGGALGLLAACDIAIAAKDASFCFSEVKLGLIPALISPYIIEALGPKKTKALFLSAEIFDASRAESLGLVHFCVPPHQLNEVTFNFAKQITHHAPLALQDVKTLVDEVKNQAITRALIDKTAAKIAAKRVSAEGQIGLKAFLNKQKPQWKEE
jgi:methylglutaconyl-CoA hydratase